MAPRTARPPTPPATVYPIVIGPRAALDRYAGQPWADVRAAAEAGRDGLCVATSGGETPGADEFSLRELVHHGSGFDGLACLLQQRW